MACIRSPQYQANKISIFQQAALIALSELQRIRKKRKEKMEKYMKMGGWLSDISIAVIRYHDQGNLQNKGVIWNLQFQKIS